MATLAVLFGLGECPERAAAAQQTSVEAAPLPSLLPVEQVWLAAMDAAPAAAGALDSERVYLPLQTKRLVAIERSTGIEAWTQELDVVWPPVVADSSVFVAASGGVHELDAATGRTKMVVALPAQPAGPMTLVGDLILIPLESRDLLALRTDGRILWHVALAATSHTRAAVGATGVAYLSLSNACVVAVSLANGRVMWTTQLDGTLSEPVAARQRVFVGSTNKVFYALNENNGRREWYKPTGGDVLGAAADDATVYVASLDNVVRALERGNGNLRWQVPTTIRAVSPPQLVGGALLITGVRPALTVFEAGSGTSLGIYALPADLETAILDGAPLISWPAEPGDVSLVLVMRDGRVMGLGPAAKEVEAPASDVEKDASPPSLKP